MPTQHRVYQYYSEEDILCVEENQVDLSLVTQQSHQILQEAGFHHIHMGLVMIRIYTLYRRDTGIMVLVVLRDTRWRGNRSIIAIMEMDLTIDYLASRGVIALPGTRFTTEELRQQRWILQPSTRRSPMAPTRLQTHALQDDSVSLQFQGYTHILGERGVQINQEDEEITSPKQEILAMMRESYEELYVQKLHPDATLPTRKMNGSAGYDLSIIHTYDIGAGDRELLATGIAVAIPEGHYERVAPRSGTV
ncbi:hypothetical protein ZIOFF_013345 [Zingiber officinale]|uniref:dUTP diphosphatase n=1 Tax=Zingiber officinale TaxID=94328 RepID=A0A8J5LNT9_ZINOF|nr:hypothetical protein ZIOFF_013345 [Zingiber officinale]